MRSLPSTSMLTSHRLAGSSDLQLRVVAEAQPGEFVGTKRIEEDWPGYGWRSALDPTYFRSLSLLLLVEREVKSSTVRTRPGIKALPVPHGRVLAEVMIPIDMAPCEVRRRRGGGGSLDGARCGAARRSVLLPRARPLGRWDARREGERERRRERETPREIRGGREGGMPGRSTAAWQA